MWGLLEEFWSHKEVVPRQNSFCGSHFQANQGTTRGGLASLTLFNVAVDNVVRHCLPLTVEDKPDVHDRLGVRVGSRMGVFYADDEII